MMNSFLRIIIFLLIFNCCFSYGDKKFEFKTYEYGTIVNSTITGELKLADLIRFSEYTELDPHGLYNAATDDRIMFKVALDNRGGMKILENEYKILARLKEIPSDVGNLGCLRVYKFHSKAIIRTKKKMMSRLEYETECHVLVTEKPRKFFSDIFRPNPEFTVPKEEILRYLFGYVAAVANAHQKGYGVYNVDLEKAAVNANDEVVLLEYGSAEESQSDLPECRENDNHLPEYRENDNHSPEYRENDNHIYTEVTGIKDKNNKIIMKPVGNFVYKSWSALNNRPMKPGEDVYGIWVIAHSMIKPSPWTKDEILKKWLKFDEKSRDEALHLIAQKRAKYDGEKLYSNYYADRKRSFPQYQVILNTIKENIKTGDCIPILMKIRDVQLELGFIY